VVRDAARRHPGRARAPGRDRRADRRRARTDGARGPVRRHL